MNRNIKKEKGFALLFAVLISGLLITIGISIFNISIKELMISASIRDSQTAYYAADSAAECFYYWNEISPDYFRFCDTSSCDRNIDEVICNKNNANLVEEELNHFSSNSFFRYSNEPTDTLEPVASIDVIKSKIGEDIKVELVFRGYNTGETGRRVERTYRRILFTN